MTLIPSMSEVSVPALEDVFHLVDVSDTTDDPTGSSRKMSLARMLGNLIPSVCEGRLTLSSGNPVYPCPVRWLTPSSTDTTADTIGFAVSHGWSTGQSTLYQSTAGGLTAGTVYYARVVDANTISLHPTAADAHANANKVDLTASLTATFIPLDLHGNTLYFSPYKGNRVSLYDGTRWKLYTFSEISLSLSELTGGTIYDVFLYDNSGTLALELTAWSNDTDRATALAQQDGVDVKSGAPTRRYVGSVLASEATTIGHGRSILGVWNAYNRVPHSMSRPDSASTISWTYTTSTWRAANGDANNRLTVIVGKREDMFVISQSSQSTNSHTSEVIRRHGIGVNRTNGNDADITPQASTFNSVGRVSTVAYLTEVPRLGRTTYTWVEHSGTGGVTTWYGTAGTTGNGIAGIFANVFC